MGHIERICKFCDQRVQVGQRGLLIRHNRLEPSTIGGNKYIACAGSGRRSYSTPKTE